MREKLTLPALMLSGCLLTGCATNTAGTVVDSSCRSFKPISSSVADTEPTRRQIVGHNRAYDAICATKAERRIAAVGWP